MSKEEEKQTCLHVDTRQVDNQRVLTANTEQWTIS